MPDVGECDVHTLSNDKRDVLDWSEAVLEQKKRPEPARGVRILQGAKVFLYAWAYRPTRQAPTLIALWRRLPYGRIPTLESFSEGCLWCW